MTVGNSFQRLYLFSCKLYNTSAFNFSDLGAPTLTLSLLELWSASDGSLTS